MILCKRILVTRQSDGNDFAHEYEIEVFASIAEFVSAMGEDSTLGILNRWIAANSCEAAKNSSHHSDIV